MAARKAKHTDVAGIFRGFIPDSFGAHGCARILYVGKATSGTFHEPSVHKNSFNGSYAFWDFARSIASAVGCRVEECIAWSNISKLSRTGIAADPKLVLGLADLAIATLQVEIETVDPSVIVFVTHHFHDEVVRAIADGDNDSDWEKSEGDAANNVDDVWWKRRHDGRGVLWMGHPQRASNDKREFAARKVVELSEPDIISSYHAV